jgi:hypothetical protein
MRTENTSRTNLIWNPSFETGVSNWTASGAFSSLSQDTNYKQFGTYSAKGVATSNSTVDVAGNFFPVNPGGYYIGSVYVRVSVEKTVAVNFRWYDDAYGITQTQYVTGTTVPANTWTRISGIGIVYRDASYGKMVITTSLSTSTEIYLDGALVEEGTTLGDYFDGSYAPNYAAPVYDLATAWSGAAHASESTLTYKTRVAFERVDSLSFNGGRRTATDVTSVGACSFEMREPTYFPEIGEKVEVFYGDHLLWLGYVNDSTLEHGIADGTDTLTVSADSYLARAGRAHVSITSQTSQAVTSLLSSAATSVDLVGQTTPTSSIVASHNAYSGNLLSYIQRLQMTAFAQLKENGEFIRLVTREFAPFTQRGGGFTDSTSPTSTQVRFYDLRFAALADNGYDSVRIEPETVAAVAVGDNARTFVASTYSASTNDATELATYIKNTFVPSLTTPCEISFLVNAQPNDTWAEILDYAAQVGEATGAGGVVGQRQTITFRGVDYQAIVLGFSFSANPQTAKVTLYFGPESLFPDLVLDDDELGQLNYSKLG